MHTGDLAAMDEDGYVNIVGRIKDMVIRGGENIYPREIEEFLYTHPDISDVQVIGVPEQRYGEELMAWVVLRMAPSRSPPRQVRAFCAGRAAHYKIPRYVRIVDEFPMTVTGKVRKVEMRERAVEILGLHEAARTSTPEPRHRSGQVRWIPTGRLSGRMPCSALSLLSSMPGRPCH